MYEAEDRRTHRAYVSDGQQVAKRADVKQAGATWRRSLGVGCKNNICEQVVPAAYTQRPKQFENSRCSAVCCLRVARAGRRDVTDATLIFIPAPSATVVHRT